MKARRSASPHPDAHACPCRKPNPAGARGRIAQCFCLMREAYSLAWSVLVLLFRSRVGGIRHHERHGRQNRSGANCKGAAAEGRQHPFSAFPRNLHWRGRAAAGSACRRRDCAGWRPWRRAPRVMNASSLRSVSDREGRPSLAIRGSGHETVRELSRRSCAPLARRREHAVYLVAADPGGRVRLHIGFNQQTTACFSKSGGRLWD